MRICPDHWALCRHAIDERGMSGLVANSGEEAMESAVMELRGETPPFDPLMSMNWYFANAALKAGGLYLVTQREDGVNDGHYCPICEFEKNAPGFVAEEVVGRTADAMLQHCRDTGLLPRPS